VEVGCSRVGGLQRWCRFNALVLAREGRQRDEALPEDEAEAASSSWLNGKEAWHNVAASTRGKVAPGRGKEGDDTSWAEENFTGPKNEENPRG
jgi:hypothetical protein